MPSPPDRRWPCPWPSEADWHNARARLPGAGARSGGAGPERQRADRRLERGAAGLRRAPTTQFLRPLGLRWMSARVPRTGRRYSTTWSNAGPRHGMGGAERLEKHRHAGKLDARARIDHLLDPGSFMEIGTLVGGSDAPADAVVIGSGSVDGRPVMVAAEDFTVLAGTISSRGQRQAVPRGRTGGDRSGAAGDDARRRRLPGRRQVARAHPDRSAGPGPLLGPGPTGDRHPRSFCGPWGAGRSHIGLHRDERPGVGIHGRAARRPRVHRGADLQGGPGWAQRRRGQRPGPQRRL